MSSASIEKPQTNLPATIQKDFGDVQINSGLPTLQNYRDLSQHCQLMFDAGFGGAGTKSHKQVMVKFLMSKQLDIPEMAAYQGIIFIHDTPSMVVKLKTAIAMRSGELEKFEETSTGDGESLVCKCVMKRKGMPAEVVSTYGIKDAMKAGLAGKDNYRKDPKRMCQLRARGRCLDDLFSDKLMGMASYEDVRDFAEPEQPRITSGEVVPPKDLDEAAALIDQDQPAIQHGPEFDEEAEFALAAAKADEEAIAAGDAFGHDGAGKQF